MEPMKRRPEVEKLLDEVFGTVEAIRANRCVAQPIGCGRAIPPNEFWAEYWSAVERTEYSQSGLCNQCQDDLFSKSIGED